MLEVLMTKNENNSHAFMKKMSENIKLTRDAQSPDEPKANEVRNAAALVLGDELRVSQAGFVGSLKELALTFLWFFRDTANCKHCLYVSNLILSKPC